MSPGARAVVAVLSLYRMASAAWPRRCRFEPTCSAYGIEAVRAHGALRGLLLTGARIARCHPWNPGGVDAVPAAHGPARGRR